MYSDTFHYNKSLVYLSEKGTFVGGLKMVIIITALDIAA